jgi:glutamate-1-semialdehyde aminotransferase
VRIPGFTSTGSKRPDALYGFGAPRGLPVKLVRAEGAFIWDVEGRRYLDFIMGLGAVALGYAHPAVSAAAKAAIDAGVVGPLAPEAEESLAEQLATVIPMMERCRFLKTGAEAGAAAVRLARAHTGRDLVLRCGYHGWLDWAQSPGSPGVPAAVAALAEVIPFNDTETCRSQIRARGDRLAAVVVEPVVEAAPSKEWLVMLREETRRVGAVLVFDEIKTGFRIAPGGATERYGVVPDLMVLGKAIASGFPLAVVGGHHSVMERARQVWISSTLATEMVSLAAASATVSVMVREAVPAHLQRVGQFWWEGLSRLAARHPAVIAGVAGIPQMCFLRFASEGASAEVARAAAERGMLFKRSAYNFVSLAHTPELIQHALGVLDEACVQAAGHVGPEKRPC